MPIPELTHLSLFTGIGGLDLAAEWAGFTTVGQCELADYQTKVLEKHWPDVPRWKDIRTLTGDSFYERSGGKTVTVISGGFPCQPHSLAGKRKASNDERDLWDEYYRVICEINPKWVVAENVRGLLSSENGRFFGRVLRDLAKWGGGVWWYCFPCSAVGAPFRGERVAIVATSKCIRWDCVDEIQKTRPDEIYLEFVEQWEARQADILSPMVRPESIPKRRHMRNDDGISEQMDRFNAIGNSVAPPHFYPIFKAIAQIELGGKCE